MLVDVVVIQPFKLALIPRIRRPEALCLSGWGGADVLRLTVRTLNVEAGP